MTVDGTPVVPNNAAHRRLTLDSRALCFVESEADALGLEFFAGLAWPGRRPAARSW